MTNLLVTKGQYLFSLRSPITDLFSVVFVYFVFSNIVSASTAMELLNFFAHCCQILHNTATNQGNYFQEKEGSRDTALWPNFSDGRS